MNEKIRQISGFDQDVIMALYRVLPLRRRIQYSVYRGWLMGEPYAFSGIDGRLFFYPKGW